MKKKASRLIRMTRQRISVYFLAKDKDLASCCFEMKLLCRKIYSIVSVISTLAVFSAFFLFCIGKVGLETRSDDDLIMHSIKRQIPETLSISNIITYDIHGFGNKSIIVLAESKEFSRENQGIANQLLIFDQINNDFLSRVYNLFGYGSSYKLSYIFSLGSKEEDEWSWGYEVQLLDIVELTGDLSKEIIVKFMSIPAGTSGYYQIGVFSYSFEDHSYYLLGTYPHAGKYECNEAPYVWNTPAETIFNSKDALQYNLYNDNEIFELEYGTYDDNDFYIENSWGEILLVRTQMIWGESHVEPHRHIVSVFEPVYDIEFDQLNWNVIFSQETKEYIKYCSEEFVKDFLLSFERPDIIIDK